MRSIRIFQRVRQILILGFENVSSPFCGLLYSSLLCYYSNIYYIYISVEL